MREINNNMDIGKAQKVDVKSTKLEKVDSQPIGGHEERITDFSNPSAEVLGRSQVSKTDNLQEDVSFGLAHPQAIELSDKLFNLAYDKLSAEGDPNAYEKACAIATSSEAKDILCK